MWHHYMSSFMHDWVFLIVDFFLRKLISASLYCDSILLLVLAAWLVVSHCCLFFLIFVTDQYGFTAWFVFFFFLISVELLFSCNSTSRFVGFRFILLGLCLAFHIAFDLYVWCGCSCPFRIRERFPFRILHFRVWFSGAFWSYVEPCVQWIFVLIPII